MKFKIIASIIISLLFFSCTKETAKVEQEKFDTIKTYYKNGKLKTIEILKDSVKMSHKFFDKKGVILNHGYKPGHVIFFTYKNDKSLSQCNYYKFWLEKGKKTGMMDSAYVYFHSPNELAIKHYKKDKKYFMTYYKDNKVVRIDTVAERKILDAEINKYLGSDTLIEGYVPDIYEDSSAVK